MAPLSLVFHLTTCCDGTGWILPIMDRISICKSDSPTFSRFFSALRALGGGPDLRFRRHPEVAPKTDHAVISPFRIFSGFPISNGMFLNLDLLKNLLSSEEGCKGHQQWRHYGFQHCLYHGDRSPSVGPGFDWEFVAEQICDLHSSLVPLPAQSHTRPSQVSGSDWLQQLSEAHRNCLRMRMRQSLT